MVRLNHYGFFFPFLMQILLLSTIKEKIALQKLSIT